MFSEDHIAQMTPAQLERVVGIIDPLSTVPMDEYSEAYGMTSLQICVRKFFEVLLHSKRCKGVFDKLIVQHCSRVINFSVSLIVPPAEDDSTKTTSTNVAKPSLRQTETIVSSTIAHTKICSELFTSRNILDESLSTCTDMALSALSRGMVLRFTPGAETLTGDDKVPLAVNIWEGCMTAFNIICCESLMWALTVTSAEASICDSVLRHMETYWATCSSSSALPAVVDDRNSRLLRDINEKTLAGAFSNATLGTRYIQMLENHAISAVGQEQLTSACYESLLIIAQKGSKRQNDLAEPAYNSIMKRAEVAFDSSVAVATLTSTAVSELRVLLSGLKRLETEIHGRDHLLKLYPRFCRCIILADSGVRSDLTELMLLVGTQFLPLNNQQ